MTETALEMMFAEVDLLVGPINHFFVVAFLCCTSIYELFSQTDDRFSQLLTK